MASLIQPADEKDQIELFKRTSDLSNKTITLKNQLSKNSMSKVIENYILKEVVGSGQYGKVFKSNHQKTGDVFAVKAIKVEKFKSVPKLQEFTNNEIQTLTKLVNPNVITFIEMLRTQNNVYLVYEFCNGGTLEDVIKKKKFLNEKEALVIFQQIINAFRSLFKENILHRDLKPSNILLHDGLIKVADFGFCKTLLSPFDLTQTMVGSPIYMAPEILKGQNYNIKADIWSMGVVLFEMLFGFCPFEDKTIPRLINQIDSKPLTIPKHINNISPKIEELLIKMLTVDPNKRIEWNTLLTFPLFERSPLMALNSNQTANLNSQQSTSQLNGASTKASSSTSYTSQPQSSQEQQSVPQPTQLQIYQLPSTQKVQQNSMIQSLLETRTRVVYQFQALNILLELNESCEQSPIVGFLILKNIANQIEYLKTSLKQQAQLEPENQTMQQLFEIIQKEVEVTLQCLTQFKTEIEKIISSNQSYSHHLILKKEHSMQGVDFENFRQSVLSFTESLRYSICETNLKMNDLKLAQMMNMILNCFLSEEYFSNNIESYYNDYLYPNKAQDVQSLMGMIQYKSDLARQKQKPFDKNYMFN